MLEFKFPSANFCGFSFLLFFILFYVFRYYLFIFYNYTHMYFNNLYTIQCIEILNHANYENDKSTFIYYFSIKNIVKYIKIIALLMSQAVRINSNKI